MKVIINDIEYVPMSALSKDANETAKAIIRLFVSTMIAIHVADQSGNILFVYESHVAPRVGEMIVERSDIGEKYHSVIRVMHLLSETSHREYI